MKLHVPPAEWVKIQPDRWSAPFWAAASEHRLVCAQCSVCKTCRMPPGPFCPRCRSQDVEWRELSGHGTIFTFTVIYHPVVPVLRDHVPYAVAAVTLPDADGVRLLGNLVGVDSDDVAVGMNVEIEWADFPDGLSVPRFRPSDDAA